MYFSKFFIHLKFTFAILFFTLISCNENSLEQSKDTSTPPKDSSMMVKTDTGYITVDTSKTQPIAVQEQIDTPKKPNPRSIYPIGTFKTYPQIMRSLFSNGSTKQEVLAIQGKPDLIEKYPPAKEIWYYGNCEITFNNDYVVEVTNQNKTIKYVDDLYEMLFSDDPIQSKFAKTLLNRYIDRKTQKTY